MVLPPDFLNAGGDTNQDLGVFFCHFGYFLVFGSFGDTFCLNDRHGLDPIRVVTNSFIFADFLQPLQVWRQITAPLS